MTLPRLRSFVVIAAAAVGAMGALHLPIARPLLARLGLPCPVDNVSAAQVENMHRAAVEALRGASPAPTLDVYGLTIMSNREPDVREWAAALGMQCKSVVRGMHYLSCTDVSAAAIGGPEDGEAIDDLTFAFDSSGLLVGVDALRGGLSDDQGAALGSSVEQRLGTELGAPTEKAGVFSASHLGEQAFATSYVKYRFSNYLVSLTAIQMPGRGVTVREQYVGVPAAVERES